MWKDSEACLRAGKSSVFRTKKKKKNQKWVQVRLRKWIWLNEVLSSEQIVCPAIWRFPSLLTIPGLTTSTCLSAPENIRLSFVLHQSVLQTGFSLQGFTHFPQTVRREGLPCFWRDRCFINWHLGVTRGASVACTLMYPTTMTPGFKSLTLTHFYVSKT